MRFDPFRTYALDPAHPAEVKPQSAAPSPATVQAVRSLPDIAETPGTDEAAGTMALQLLDLMLTGSAASLPQERALAADALLLILPKLPARHLLAVAERVAIMEAPPPVLAASLLRDPRPAIVAPLIERCMVISDQDLIEVAAGADATKRRMIAQRRIVSQVLAEHLISLGDPSTLLALVRNPGADFSFDTLLRLTRLAAEERSILVPLATRSDLPVAVAFELFWPLPPELRRYIMSRFLTDSEVLTQILKSSNLVEKSGDSQFPGEEIVEKAASLLIEGNMAEAAGMFAQAAAIHPDAAMRILADQDGEPLMVILKALGISRAGLAHFLPKLTQSGHSAIRADRNVLDLQGIFDSLSFSKARVLLTYWDWSARNVGPYVMRQK